MHGLHHHDRVVHHDADGQHQGEQRDQVDGQPEELHHEEGADQRHRHGQDGDQRGTPVAQEQEHHQGHQDERVAERVQHLFNGGVQEGAHVIAHLVVHPRGHELGLVLQGALHLFDHVAGIAAQGLLQHDGGRGLPVQVAVDVEEGAAQFHIGDVAELDHLALLVGPDDDVLVLFGFVVLPLVHQHVLQRLGIDPRTLAQSAGACEQALFLHGLQHLLRAHLVGPHAVRFHPDAHGIDPAAQDLGLCHARHPLDLRKQLGVGIVVKEELVRIVTIPVEVDVHEHAGLHGRDDDALALYQHGQVGHHLVHAGLHTDHRLVRVGARFEDHADGALSGACGVAGHVAHALHPVDRRLQLDDGRLGEDVRARTGERDEDVHRGGRDLRELRGGQLTDGQSAHEEDQHRDHNGQYRPMDEVPEHGPGLFGIQFQVRHHAVGHQHFDVHFVPVLHPSKAFEQKAVLGLKPLPHYEQVLQFGPYVHPCGMHPTFPTQLSDLCRETSRRRVAELPDRAPRIANYSWIVAGLLQLCYRRPCRCNFANLWLRGNRGIFPS